MTSITQALKEYHYLGQLTQRESARAYLIARYWDKASHRLHDDYEDLMDIGKARFDVFMKDIISRPNPLLKMISKYSDGFRGTHLPIPTVYGANK